MASNTILLYGPATSGKTTVIRNIKGTEIFCGNDKFYIDEQGSMRYNRPRFEEGEDDVHFVLNESDEESDNIVENDYPLEDIRSEDTDGIEHELVRDDPLEHMQHPQPFPFVYVLDYAPEERFISLFDIVIHFSIIGSFSKGKREIIFIKGHTPELESIIGQNKYKPKQHSN